MPGLNRIMDQGKLAMAANQIGLSTTSHNISNKDTEGYSRQRVDMTAADPTEIGGHRIGNGVRVGAIRRSHSEFVARRLEKEGSNFGKFEAASEVYQQLESIFTDDSKLGVTAAVSQFFDDMRTLSTQPGSTSLRAAVRESARSVAGRFSNVNTAIDEVVSDVDRRIEGSVVEANDLLKNIASLNQRIMQIESDARSVANDERDARDLALKKLASHFDIKVSNLEKGGVNVSIDGVGPIVNGVEAMSFEAVRGNQGPIMGSTRILLKDPSSGRMVDKTEKFLGGKVGGLIEVRDTAVVELREKLDRLAYSLNKSVNSVHSQAFTKDGANGVGFFKDLNQIKGASANLGLSAEVENSLGNIATGFVANAPGDNRALLEIADLQNSKILEGGKASFSEYAAGAIGSLGVESKTAYQGLETQQGVLDQLNSLREQNSGVSLDEEAMNMLKYQKGFDASAKLIQVADSMLETVLSLKRF